MEASFMDGYVNSIGCSRHGHGLFSSLKPTHDVLYVDPSHSCTTQIMQDVLGGVTVFLDADTGPFMSQNKKFSVDQ